ncbi:hypothetical protein Lalb_Chr22g0361211 [Lupinus albus]|uniref:Uncharacterized protein n=1 Tax=Lupinus albus TaxID=3870 RepID=A0A6A4NHN2_LUPAL|nr:hypothetical protein Lalb_Chr22g0361211 [Lupinus albus]
MEKGKSRTDLLAAGRKKLQQYRQKKDSKGGSSRGKSSNKSSKHQQLESDVDAASSNPMPVESSQITDGNAETDSNVVITESLESQSLANSLAPDNIDPSVDSSSVAITYDSSSIIGVETEVDSNSKLALQQVQGENDSELSVKDQGESARNAGPYVETEVDSNSKLALQQVQADNDSELSVKDQGESARNAGPYVAQDIFLSTSDSLRFEGGATNDPVSAPVDILSPSVSFKDAVGDSVPVEREGEKKEESLHLFEDIPNTSKGRSGAMQEADGLDMMKSDQITDATSVGEKKLSLFEVGDGEQLKQLGKSVEIFSSFRDTVSDNLSGSDKEQEDGIATTGPSMSNLARGTLPDSSFEGMPPHSSQEQIIERLSSGQDRELQDELNQHCAPVESEVVDKTHELSKRAHEIDSDKPLDVYPIFDSSSVNLSQLAVIIRNLNEEEYDFLLKSRGAVSDPGPLLSSSIIQDNAISDAFERLKEELFLANLMKNIFNLQLAEQLEQQLESDNQHYQLVDKLSQLQAFNNEVNEKNQHLNEELANCRVELHNVSSRSVEMQNQFNIADANMEALSSRVVELQLCFEIAQKDSLDLSTELADCRGLISGLQEENRGMNEVNEKNKQLNEELEKCRFELQNVSSRSVEMQNQFNIAEANVEVLSARVIDLHVCFEIAQKESLDLSTELVDCRGLISGLQEENKGIDETLSLMITEKNKLVEEKEFHLHESKKLATELADFKSLVEALKAENSNLIDRISLVTEDKNTIKAEIEHLTNKVDMISLDLAENKNMVASLQEENSNLCGNLALSADKIKNLEEENQPIVLENQRLSFQLVELQEELALEKGERMRFETDLKEATGRLEQLTKENVLLTSTLDEHKAKIEEIGKKPCQPRSQHGYLGNQAHISRKKSEGLKIAIAEDSLHMDQNPEDDSPGGPPQNLIEHEVFDDTLGFVSLNTCLNEAEQVLLKLEKSVNVLHSRSGSFGRSTEKLSSPRISRLIQAFESKSPEDEHEVEGKDSSAVQSPSDSFMLTKDQIGHLRKLLTKWKLDVQNAGTLFKGERDGRKIDDAKYNDLKHQFQDLQQHCSNVEASNIELAVQCEAAKQLLGDIEEKKCHLDDLCKALKQEGIHLKTKNYELYEKLGHCHSKISELRTEMYGVKQCSNEMVSSIDSELENLQKEVTERAAVLGQGWNTTIAEIVELIRKLNESVGKTLSSISDSDNHDNMDISHRLAVSVNAATEMIFDLQKKLDATYSELDITSNAHKEVNLKCDDLLGRNEFAVGVLHKMYNDLRKVVLDHGGSIDEGNIDGKIEALPDLLNFNNYQVIMEHLGDILNTKLELESVAKEMKSELVQREIELEEWKMKCLGLDSVSKLIEDVAGVLNVETSMVEINKSPLSCLESLVSSLLQKNRETEIRLHMTKEGHGSKEIELSELKENIYSLDNLRVENENEILVLKENLHQAEEALSATRSELHEKTHELENSEQRVSSIREKLGIAVSKGKGLVVQRDGLKQSLAETSSELERCLQELQLKDARLHEVETKLKTYAEAGERVDALESELSYIRNSANALRESFLLKDSVLQRIEEVLEDLDLPEQFHSKDIIEKIDWLARLVAANSLSMNEWGQKDSAGGGSYSDGGYVVTDSWKKDDSPLQPDSEDDFRKKFEEVQTKYYVLAEQNEMLEQSLMERNNLVQRWEELVDRIDMPSNLQSMEMEDRIEWVGGAFAEANHHVHSLQLEIEKYDSYCGLLNADLEESQRRLSAVQADHKALASEREHLSEKMEALILEHEKLSSQTKQTELENEKLHNEITSMKDELERKAAHEEQVFTINGKIRKLQDLVSDALSEFETEDLDSIAPNIDSLEELLRKLIANHASFSPMKPPVGVPLDGNHLQKDVDTLHEARSIDLYDREESNVDRHKKDLEEALSELVHVKEERDKILEKQTSLSGEIEVLSKRYDELQELLDRGEANIDRYKNDLEQALSELVHVKEERDGTLRELTSLSGEFEVLHKRNDELQELLNQTEANVDRYRKDLEVALSELVHVKEERDRTLEKQTSLSADVDTLSKRNEELQQLLNQEEQKTASVREKLNVAVRKGKLVVQQRDSLKQTIEGMSIEMEHLKSEIINREHTLEEHARKLTELLTYPGRLEALESESLLLKSHLERAEHNLKEQENYLKLILDKLGEIEFEGEGHISDPVKKLEWIGKRCFDLRGAVVSSEQESRKSKRAAELLLAELNEVQERNDAFQEELANVAAELNDLRKHRDSAEAAKLEALSHLEKLSALHEKGKSHLSEIMGLKSSINQFCKGFGEVQNLMANAFFMDLESFRSLEAGLESCMKGNNAASMVDSSVKKGYEDLLDKSSDYKSLGSKDSWSDFVVDHYDDNALINFFHLLGHQLQEFLVEIPSLKERINVHSSLAQEKDKTLSKLMMSIQREMTSQRESWETMKKEIRERDGQLVALHRNIAYLYEACINSVNVIENGKAGLVGNKVESSDPGVNVKLPSFDDGMFEECVKTMGDRLSLAAKEFASIKTEFLDANQKEMNATITNLQRELQEKDVQRDRICSDLVKQIKDAEAAASSYSKDLQSVRIQEHNLKKQVDVVEAEKKKLEQRLNELQDRQGMAAELEEKIRSQTDLLATKDQEIEELMHAIDEEEMQIEDSKKKIAELEKVVQQKSREIENLESSRGKVMKKLSITVNKFDELHHLSASLLSEVEKLQSQLQERDAEISFLRQEVTRSTNDVLHASQMSNQRNSDELFEFLMWVDMIVSQEGMHDIHPDMKSNNQVHEYKEILHRKLMSVLSELENLRTVTESKDTLLQLEKSKLEESNHKVETLERSLREKELQLNLLEGVEEPGKGASTSSEIVEVEPAMNEWSARGTFVAPQVRSLRKGNTEHVAIAVDEDPGSISRIEDEEDDKVHGFKSLTSSKVVPRFTRPLTNLIDGLWVSCDRTLMRQPVLRLGIIIYWVIMHAILAFVVV